MERKYRENDTTQKSSGWQCVCWRINASYVGICACGETKSSSSAKIESTKQEEIKKQKEETELQNMRKLLEYKNLLDSNIITEEEYEKKKKELLDI